MPSFMDKAAASDEEIRKTQERDPADLSGAEEPDWDNPETWGGGGSDADDSASRNDGGSDGGNEDQEPPAAEGAGSPPKPAARRAPRRAGRPRGPERAPLSVRVLVANDRMLTVAVEQTGKNPQTLVDEALGLLFKKLKIEDPGTTSQQAHDVA